MAMRNRLISILSVVLMAAAVTLVTPSLTAGDEAGQTEDILRMVDGRVLHGNIVSENSYEIVFEYIDRRLGLKTKLRLNADDVQKIERDVAITTTTAQVKSRKTRRTSATSRPSTADPETARYGQSKYDSLAANVPTVYLVPFKGAMGTDIHLDIYEKVVEDILAHDPDLVIFVMDSAEYRDIMIPDVDDPAESRGVMDIPAYQALVTMLKDDLADYRQVLWIKDSVGLSSMLALAWDEIYMSPDARFWGLGDVIERSGAGKHSDDDVRAKMSAAWSALVKTFVEHGGYSMALADAMMWPEKKLSASYRGREVVWSLNDLGEYLIDGDTEATLGLHAKDAEDLLISDGTVETLDDLAFLLGYREYREIDGDGSKLVDDYVEKWRASFEKTKELWADYNQHLSYASGQEQMKWLGRAKLDLEKIIQHMNRYEAVEIRWQRDMGGSKFGLEILVEKLKEQIQALKGRRRGGGGGGGSGFGGGGPG